MIDKALPMLIRLLSGVHARWIHCEPSLIQRVYFANHTSNLDALVIWASLPDPIRRITRPVAAHDYWTATTLRRKLATDVFHAILIERKKVTASNNPIDIMIREMGSQHSIIIFPEGGRNPGPEPGPFKNGIYHLARQKSELEFVPVYIDNANRVLPKGEVLPVPLLISVSMGTPLKLAEGEPKQTFIDRCRNAVIQLSRL